MSKFVHDTSERTFTECEISGCIEKSLLNDALLETIKLQNVIITHLEIIIKNNKIISTLLVLVILK